MHTDTGHSSLLNTKALQWTGINTQYAARMGRDLAHVDDNCEPDGYICEQPVFEFVSKLSTTLEDAMAKDSRDQQA